MSAKLNRHLSIIFEQHQLPQFLLQACMSFDWILIFLYCSLYFLILIFSNLFSYSSMAHLYDFYLFRLTASSDHVQNNVKGALHITEFCKQLKYLTCLVHVSTAYSHCNHKVVDEKLYPIKITPTQLLDLHRYEKSMLEKLCMLERI